MELFHILLVGLVAGVANAACPNSCSGHGTCGVDEVCTCFPGWGMEGQAGGDCSDRFCPYELAWVDSPDKFGRRHKYHECSGKGMCDRKTGECECFQGYEGKSCARHSCPNHCSGHGTCEYMKDLTYGVVYNDYHDGSSLELSGLGAGAKTFDNNAFDMNRARACVCDPLWTGLDCQQRMCPFGNDVLDVMPGFDETSTLGLPGYGNEVAQVQTITLYDTDLDNSNFASKSFALRFTSKLNETYVTKPIAWSTDDATLQAYIEASLVGLPNKVIDDVSVSVDSSIDVNGVVIDVAFTGMATQGKQHKLEVLADKCEEGCSPRLSGLTNLRAHSSTTLSTTEISTVGSHQSYECGRRGKCNRADGLCECFAGFTGEACGIITSLAGEIEKT